MARELISKDQMTHPTYFSHFLVAIDAFQFNLLFLLPHNSKQLSKLSNSLIQRSSHKSSLIDYLIKPRLHELAGLTNKQLQPWLRILQFDIVNIPLMLLIENLGHNSF